VAQQFGEERLRQGIGMVRSAKAFSAGKMCRSSQSSNCSPCEAMRSICG
jgi:hypothetical protein